ncbi:MULTISPECIES: hypothetical protein [unclassified Pseudodesulfovibrio]|uniref:hypothetical protein n=1 Tax=unclassified Pseudodesulfovibrio TaxID=2661612 RepID=UPI000FEBD6A3|nr:MULTISPECIES: hypothetical protein [unclassified Pseudodesulfovibrio]MCJ2165551.1 hypothetical protein [Pseudodesulfovibrio sp. S3-i]
MRVFEMELRRDQNGRIVDKIEMVKGRPVAGVYAYDAAGRLFEARIDGRLVCRCYYDKAGRRMRDYLPATAQCHAPGRWGRVHPAR